MSLTPEQLRSGTDLIYYEMSMLLNAHTVPSMIKTNYPDVVSVVGSLLLEARLVHARNLIAFFRETRTHSDDLMATDYDFPYQSLAIKNGTMGRLNKELSHNTSSRQIIW